MEARQFEQLTREIMQFFEDSDVDEVLVNGVASACAVQGDTLKAISASFESIKDLTLWSQHWARRLGVRLDPLVGAAGGSFDGQNYRWHCVMPPLAPDGPLFSIRRHRFDQLDLSRFEVDSDTLSKLEESMIKRANILICGPTGSGKTSVLSTLLRTYAGSERVILVESLPELPLPTPFSARLIERQANLEQVGAFGLDRLLREALRLRPDRLVVGEVRGAEAAVLCEALLSGHQGVMATIHAATSSEAVSKLGMLAGLTLRASSASRWCSIPIGVLKMQRGCPPRLASLSQEVIVPSA